MFLSPYCPCPVFVLVTLFLFLSRCFCFFVITSELQLARDLHLVYLVHNSWWRGRPFGFAQGRPSPACSISYPSASEDLSYRAQRGIPIPPRTLASAISCQAPQAARVCIFPGERSIPPNSPFRAPARICHAERSEVSLSHHERSPLRFLVKPPKSEKSPQLSHSTIEINFAKVSSRSPQICHNRSSG